MLNSSTQNILDVADQGRGIAPLQSSITVGDEGVSGEKADSRRNGQLCEIHSPADSQFQGTTIDELLALVASKLPDISLSRQHELEEIEAEREGRDTAASGYPEPASDRSFA